MFSAQFSRLKFSHSQNFSDVATECQMVFQDSLIFQQYKKSNDLNSDILNILSIVELDTRPTLTLSIFPSAVISKNLDITES